MIPGVIPKNILSRRRRYSYEKPIPFRLLDISCLGVGKVCSDSYDWWSRRLTCLAIFRIRRSRLRCFYIVDSAGSETKSSNLTYFLTWFVEAGEELIKNLITDLSILIKANKND